MHIREGLFVCMLTLLLAVLPGICRAQNGSMGAVRNVGEMKFMEFPGMPTCATGAVQSGDPTQGTSIILIKVASGCAFPWHWHTPNEHLMIVSGSGVAEMKGGKPVTLQAGAYAMMPSKEVHRLRCPGGCTLYLYSDGAFDMHYVDAQGNEIAPDAALKAVKETPAKGMK